jgi:hypothetical protein
VYDRLRLSPRQRNGTLAVQGMPAQLLDYERDALSLAQDAAPCLLARHRDFL